MGKVLPILILIIVLMVIGAVVIQESPFKNIVPKPQVGVEAVYSGSLPCADCPGIDETITFYTDKTYNDKNVYQERNVTSENKGTWILKDNVYQLTDLESKHQSFYQIEGNKINPLDPDTMEPISAPFNLSLTKQSS